MYLGLVDSLLAEVALGSIEGIIPQKLEGICVWGEFTL